ncbi:hypothetical protein [Sphingobacterium spiritivorum]|uniref:hypothetical protein n=1 Tax=Sphingobacterium spiritivorum TaxID=258 RepID=UPI003DA6A5FB
MKKIIFIIYLFTICFTAYGQVEYDYYEISAGKQKEKHKIEISDKKGKIDEIYIYTRPMDKLYDNTVLIVNSKDLNTLVDYLKFVNTKFIEWSKTAEDNNIKQLEKDIDADLKDKYMFAFGNNDWHFARGVKLKSRFEVNDREPSITVYSGMVYSSTNSYIDSYGVFLTFASPEDLNNFINKLDIFKMQEVLNKKSSTENLFN